MGRPANTPVLTRAMNNGDTEEVIIASTVYAVFYMGQPINLRQLPSVPGCVVKYRHTSYPNKGHAEALARRLNASYDCFDFEVREVK